MIAIYPSNLGGLPMQTFTVSAPITLYHWLHTVRSGAWEWLIFDDGDIALDRPQRFTAQVNGLVLPQNEWASRELRPDDDVALTFEPKGGIVGDVFGFVGNVVNSVFGLFFRQPSLPNNASSRRQGDELDQATFDTNQAKLNQVIPECFGLNWRVPDLLVQTHQRYEGNIQVSYMHLSLGVGKYRVEDILIGNTPIGSFGSDAQYRVYGPSENHNGFRATENWYTAKEVGGTSSASPGLEITETFDVQTRADSSTFVLGSDNSRGVISIPSGSGSFPEGWAAGMDVRIEMPLDIRIERDDTGNYFVGEPDNIPLSRNANVTFKQGLDAKLRISDVVDDGSGNTRYYLADRDGGANVRWIDPASYHVTFGASGGTYRITSTNASTDDDGNTSAPTQIEVERYVGGQLQADWTGFTSRTVNDGQIWLSDNKPRGGYTASIAACPYGETTDSLEIDIYSAQGLTVVNPKGHELGVTVHFDIEYRDMAGGDWQVVPSSVHGDSQDAFGATIVVSLPYKMRPEVRLRKTSTDYDEDELGTLLDTIKWYALKAKLDRPSSYPGITSVAIQIRTGERLGAQAENKIKVRCTRMLTPWNDANGDPVPTRDIAPAFMYMLRNMGYSDADVDTAELARLHGVWQKRGDYFDMQFLEEKSLKDALNTCLGVGFAEMVIDRGYIVPVRDEPRLTYGQAYSLHNMISELKISTKLPFEGDADQHDGADVEYNDFNTGQKETVQCRLPGQEGIKVLKVTAEGINDRERAWRYGMRQIGREKYRVKQLEFTTGMDALNSPYLDYAAVNGDYDQYGQSAQVMDYQLKNGKAIIDTDQVFDWSGGDKVVGLQRPNGTLSDTYSATRGDDDSQIIINAPDFALSNGLEVDATRLLFGSRELPWWSVLIDSVKPQGTPQDESEPQCSVSAYNYDPRIYQYDDASLPESKPWEKFPLPEIKNNFIVRGQNSRITRPSWYRTDTPVVLCITFEGLHSSNRMYPSPNWEEPFIDDAGILYARCQFHGDTYGNQTSLDDAKALYEYAINHYNVSRTVLLGISMGGLGALNTLTNNAVEDVSGIYLIDPDCNLNEVYSRHRGSINNVYGLNSDGSDYAQKTDGYDPMLRPASDFKGVPIWVSGSFEDHSVPYIDNGAALSDKLNDSNPINRLDYGGGHTAPNHFIKSRFIDFINHIK